jgi:hypothetical protein
MAVPRARVAVAGTSSSPDNGTAAFWPLAAMLEADSRTGAVKVV